MHARRYGALPSKERIDRLAYGDVRQTSRESRESVENIELESTRDGAKTAADSLRALLDRPTPLPTVAELKDAIYRAQVAVIDNDALLAEARARLPSLRAQAATARLLLVVGDSDTATTSQQQ